MSIARHIVVSFLVAVSALAGPVCADNRVLVIGIDGLRADALESAVAPNIKALYQNGAGFYARGFSEDLTFSGPNWSSIINGVHRDLHGVDSNSYAGTNFTAYPNFLARLEAAIPGINTARYSTWSEVNNNFANPNNVDVNFYRERDDPLATSQLAGHLQSGNPHAAFLYLGDVDYAGHDHGFVNTPGPYFDAITQSDTQVGQVLTALRGRPGVQAGAENWLVIITSDHGGLPNGSHSGNSFKQREIPFIVSSLNGFGVVVAAPYVAPRNVDVTKTVLDWMEVPPSQWGQLDGHVAGLVPSTGPTLGYNRNLVFNGDAEYDRGFLDPNIDQAISGWNDQGAALGGDGERSMNLLRYGAPDFPAANSPGPPNRGANFFTGAYFAGASSSMNQTLDLAPLAADIDLGNAPFVLSAYLGGYSSQNDRAQFKVAFLAANGAELGATTLAAVTAAERGNVTGLLYREKQGVVPVGTRKAMFTLDALYAAGTATDGYADNLSFMLTTPQPASDFDGDGDVDGQDFLAWQRGVGTALPSHSAGDANGDLAVDADDLALWQSQFGLPNSAVPAPEPASWLIAAAALAFAPVLRNCRPGRG